MTEAIPLIRPASPSAPSNVATSWSVPKTTSVKVEARAIASSRLLTGKLYWQGRTGPAGSNLVRALLALMAWSSSCARTAVIVSTVKSISWLSSQNPSACDLIRERSWAK